MSSVKQTLRKDVVHALQKSTLLQFVARRCADMGDFREMLRRAEVVDFPKNMIIIQEGEPSYTMYFLLEGEVEIIVGGRSLLMLNELGDVFGEIGAITGSVRSATVSTLTPVSCLAIRTDFLDTMSREKRACFISLLQQGLSRILMDRLQRTTGELKATRERLDQAEEELEKAQRMISRLKAGSPRQVSAVQKEADMGTTQRLLWPNKEKKGE